MNIFKRKQNKQKEERGLCSMALTYSAGGINPSLSPMRLAAVYRCVQVISDSVAQLPLSIYSKGKVYDTHPAYHLVAKEPSPLMSRFTFLKCLVSAMLLQGNGYAYIKRDMRGNATEIIYLDCGVTIIPKDDGTIAYTVPFISGEVPARDMIHILNHSIDDIHGISTIAYATQTLGLASASEAHA